jgi:hypothetical protein
MSAGVFYHIDKITNIKKAIEAEKKNLDTLIKNAAPEKDTKALSVSISKLETQLINAESAFMDYRLIMRFNYEP